jgi:hypothetical protein
MPQHAKRTKVSPGDSRSEIERTLSNYGADAFGYMVKGNRAMLTFELRDRRYRLAVELPGRYDSEIIYTPDRHIERSEAAQRQVYDQVIKQRWRNLLAVIKGLLVADDTHIITLEESLLAFMVVRDRETGEETTVGEQLLPRLSQIASTGQLPALLPAPGDR